MITLSRIKTVNIPFMGVDVSFSFNVPTAEDVENVFRGPDAKDLKDSDILRKFGTLLTSPDIEGWSEGIKPEEAVKLPGTYTLINKCAVEIMQSAFLTEAEKN